MEKNGSLHAGRFPPTEGDLPRYLIGTVLRRQAVDKKVSVWWDDEFSVFLRDDRRVRRTTAAEDQRAGGGPGVHIFGVQKLCFRFGYRADGGVGGTYKLGQTEQARRLRVEPDLEGKGDFRRVADRKDIYKEKYAGAGRIEKTCPGILAVSEGLAAHPDEVFPLKRLIE